MISVALAIGVPMGRLLLVGGGETTTPMVEKFLEMCGGRNRPIVVLAQTREEPSNGASSVSLLKEHGATNVRLCALEKFDRKILQSLELEWQNVSGFWIPGGDQALFVDRFGVRWARWFFQKKRAEGVCFFGTSAGSMIMSDPMIAYSDHAGNPVTAPGIGLVSFLVDTHFRERKREPRLRKALAKGPKRAGLGLDAGEWIVVCGDEILETHGTPLWIKS